MQEGSIGRLQFCVMRDVLATPFLILVALGIDGFRLPERRDLARLFAVGFFGICCNQFLFVAGLSFTTSASAAVMTQFQPVFVVLIAHVTGVEELSRETFFGVFLSIFGAIVMIDPAAESVEVRAYRVEMFLQ